MLPMLYEFSLPDDDVRVVTYFFVILSGFRLSLYSSLNYYGFYLQYSSSKSNTTSVGFSKSLALLRTTLSTWWKSEVRKLTFMVRFRFPSLHASVQDLWEIFDSMNLLM